MKQEAGILETATRLARLSHDSSVQGVDFAELFRLHWRQVYRICLRITKNQHDAEDAAQDSFMRAYSHLHQFEGKAQITTWLNTIARNCSLMLLRAKRRKQEVPFETWAAPSNGDLPPINPRDESPDQLRRVLSDENCTRLLKGIAALPIRLRTAADLFFLDERNLKDVGQILNISYASAKSRLFRARHRLSRIDKRCSRSSEPNQRSHI